MKGTVHTSKTSSLCTWNVPRAKKIAPKPMNDINVGKPILYSGFNIMLQLLLAQIHSFSRLFFHRLLTRSNRIQLSTIFLTGTTWEFHRNVLHLHIILSGVTRKPYLDFDPRAERDRHTSQEERQHAVASLLEVFPDSGIAHLWGLYAKPPEAINYVEVQSTPSLHDAAYNMILKTG